MTKTVDKLFSVHDAAVASGNFELARAIVDCIVSREPLEKTLAGVVGHWRIEGRAVLRRRAGNMAASAPGKRSADARKLQRALSRYAASGGFERDRLPGAVPSAKNANLHLILTESNGHIPSWETLRKRRA